MFFFFCAVCCQQMPIFMVRLPAFGGSIEISSKLQGQPRQLATCDCREQLIFKSGQVQLHWLVSFYFLISCFLYSDSYETKLGNPSRVLSFTCFQWQAAIPLAGKVGETTPPPVVQLQKNDTRNRNTKEPIVEIEGCDSWDLTILEYPA